MNEWSQNLLRRVYSGVILVIWILAPYLLLQQFALGGVWWIEPSALDLMVPVNFNALWVYFSFYVLLAWVGLTVERQRYLQFLYTVGWVTWVSHMVFFLLPNGVSREAIDLDAAPAFYQWLVSWDQPRNALPSLHASLSVVAALAAMSLGRVAGGLAWLWVAAIFWSTLALRQHVVLDLLAGATVAVVCWWAVGRWCRRDLVSDAE